MKFGLENISTLCEALGHPERSFRSVLVAGTNGKGSVTAMVETALTAAGHRAARYTSPHLVRLEERFVMLGREAGTDALGSAAARVQAAAERLVAAGTLAALPTFFECTTAVAFELFHEAAIDLAVLEVGLGGRLDATNVVRPIVTAITSIDFDHQAQLGSSLASIAAEKAGIIKGAAPVVCGPLPQEAARVVREAAGARGAAVVRAAERVAMTPVRGGAVDVATEARRLPAVTLGLEGAHQRDNACVAVAILEELERLGVRVPDAAVRAGLTEVRWPARLERFDTPGGPVLLDAAHNPAGAAALAAYLRGQGARDLTLVFGVMRDKDVRGMLGALAGGAPPLWGAVVCTAAPGGRALDAAALASLAQEAVGPQVPVAAIADPAAALAHAQDRGRPVVAAGSIFLIGPLRDILR